MSSKMKTKIITAVVIIAIVVPLLAFGYYTTTVLLYLIAVGAGYEISALGTTKKKHWLPAVLDGAAMLVMYQVPKTFFSVAASIWLVVLFTIELADEKITTDQVVYPFALTVLVSLGMRCLSNIYLMPDGGFLLALYVLLACYGCDTGAYFFGVFFGRHKMIPRVSPNKTWEGSVGGYACGAVISFLYGCFVLKQFPFGLILCGSLVLPLVAQIGDLSFSSIKRRFQIKDFGWIFPEHGGVLDRIDSVIFCLMIFDSLMIIWGF